MNNETVKRSPLKVLSAAALASVITLGGIGTLPPVHAETPAPQAAEADAFAYLNDAGRMKLINLEAEQLVSSWPTQTTSIDRVEVYELLEIRNEAYAAVMDPTTSQARLQAIARKYEQKLKNYQEIVLDEFWVDNYFYKLKMAILRGVSYENSHLSPPDKRTIEAVMAAEAALGKNKTDKNYRDVFVKYYIPVQVNEFDLQTSYDKTRYDSQISRYRQWVQEDIAKAVAAGSTEDYSSYTAEIEQAISSFEQLLASSANQKKVDFSLGYISSKYDNLLAALDSYLPPASSTSERNLLVNLIARSKELLALPTDNQPGQFPATAVSKFRLVLKAAEKDLSQAKTRVEYGIAASKLDQALMKFYETHLPYAQ